MSVATTVVSRSARFRAPGDIQVETLEIKAPGAGQVCVRLEGCGVCGSNLPVWEGRSWFNYPLEPGTPGHEGWGVVESVGEGVKALAIGDRVAMLSGHAFAEHDFAAPESLVKLPPELAGKPFPGEPLACAMNIFRRSDILSGQRVAIVGVGFLGAALTALAVRAGAQVVALSRRASALEKAEEAGATATVRLEDSSQAVRDAQQCAGGDGYERVIECVGTQAALDVASALAAVRGRLVIAGYHQDGQRRVNMQDWNWRGLDVINAHERDPAQYRRGMEEAIDLVVRGEFNPWPLFTHEFPLEDISAAFAALAQRPAGFLKALVRTP
jgi:threonine dehydrogenase-like Zn-dependent dehydrogenase